MAEQADRLGAAGGGESPDPSAMMFVLGPAPQIDRIAAAADAFLEKQATPTDRQPARVERQFGELRRFCRSNNFGVCNSAQVRRKVFSHE